MSLSGTDGKGGNAYHCGGQKGAGGDDNKKVVGPGRRGNFSERRMEKSCQEER